MTLRIMAHARLLVVLAALAGFALTPRPSRAATITFYTTESAFNAAASNITFVVEDFEDANVPAGAFVGCPSPASSSTSNQCFDAGDIEPGITVKAIPDRPVLGLAIGGPGFLGVPDRAVAANYFVDRFGIDFNPGVRAVGMGIVNYSFPSTCRVTVELSNGFSDYKDITCAAFAGPIFLGVTSDGSITNIEISGYPGAGSAAEGISFIRFGRPSCAHGGLAGASLASTITGQDLNEDGPVTGQLHGAEGQVGLAAPLVHEAACAAALAGV